MVPYRKIDTLCVDQLSRQLAAQKLTPTRFSIELPEEKLVHALYAAYTAEVKQRHRELIFDEDTKKHIKSAAQWLGDPHGKPGFMMTGLLGNGKTTLMLAMCNLINWLYYSDFGSKRKSIRMLKAKDIVRMALDKNSRKEFENLFWEEMLAIDEMGEEQAEIIHYGMVHTPIRDLLEERYARQKLTIITTNLVQSEKMQLFQISERYGERVVDRMREMMKIEPFQNASYRPK